MFEVCSPTQNLTFSHSFVGTFMTKNMGSIDRAFRVLVAVAIVVAIYMDALTGTWAWVLGALSVVFVLTSLVSFCPLYTIFGMKTCKTAS